MASNVNYVAEMNYLNEESANLNISIHGVTLWMALLHIANRRAQYDSESQTYRWNEDYFPVSVQELSFRAHQDKRSIERARNELKQRGIIDFIPGDRRRSAEYKIMYISTRNVSENVFGYENAPKNVPNLSPICPQSVPNLSPYNKYIYKDGIDQPEEYRNIDYNGAVGAVMCADERTVRLRKRTADTPEEKRAIDAFKYWLSVTPAAAGAFGAHMGTVERLLNCEDYTVDVVTEAMTLTAKLNEKRKIDRIIEYLYRVMDDWTAKGYTTREKLESEGII